jgi:hypothetical protein
MNNTANLLAERTLALLARWVAGHRLASRAVVTKGGQYQ